MFHLAITLLSYAFQFFDASLVKKKKKKKPFDLEAALADGSDTQDASGAEKEDLNKDIDFDGFDDLDLDTLGGKKKKKKKKPFNLDELETNLPSGDAGEENAEDGALEGGAGDDGGNMEDDYDFDVDFSKTKKKKKKKKDLDELVAEKLVEDIQTNKENSKWTVCCV